MNTVLLGATTGMGRAIARLLAARGDALFLLGLEDGDLARSAADLTARHPSHASVGHAICDLSKPETFASALDEAERALGTIDAVIVTAAMFATQDALEDDIELTQRLVTINYANTVVFCEHARKRLLAHGGGKLVVFSSVAGERGRKPVAIYGSSKAGLSAYLEALDHKFYSQGLRVTCVKPGFVKTGMTAGLKPPPFAGDPEDVARTVVDAMDHEESVVYAPRVWSAVMVAIRSLPRAVMRRINF